MRDDTPHSLEAERAALGSVLIKPAALLDLAQLDVDDFFQPGHREIMESMRTLAARGREVDIVALADELRARDALKRLDGGMMYLSQLGDAVPTAENAAHYANTIRDKATLRRLIATCAEVMSSARGDVTNPTELMAEARAKLAGIELRGRSSSVRIGEFIEAVVNEMEQRGIAPDKHGVTTGLTRLDELIGPMRPDNLIAVGANPGRGKTALALNTAARVAKRGIPVLVFSLEMSKEQLAERELSFEAEVNGRRVSQGRMEHTEWKRVEDAKAAIEKLPLWINDDPLTLKQLCGETRSWRAQRRRERLAQGMDAKDAELALVVVDYLQLIELDEKAESRYAEVGKISRTLKRLTKKKDANLPIVELVQLNRENMKDAGKDGRPREPRVSDLRDAGNLEQDADFIMFPWWEGEAKPEGPHDARILVRKNRNGLPGTALCSWWPAFTMFADRPVEDDARLVDA